MAERVAATVDIIANTPLVIALDVVGILVFTMVVTRVVVIVSIVSSQLSLQCQSQCTCHCDCHYDLCCISHYEGVGTLCSIITICERHACTHARMLHMQRTPHLARTPNMHARVRMRTQCKHRMSGLVRG